jgi:hypothetical protein
LGEDHQEVSHAGEPGLWFDPGLHEELSGLPFDFLHGTHGVALGVLEVTSIYRLYKEIEEFLKIL